MSIAAATALASALGFYLLLGVVFALYFIVFGVGRLVPAAKGSGIGFRLTIFWGAIILWPVLLFRLLKGPAELVPPRTWRRAHARIWMVLIPLVALGVMAALMLRPAAPLNDALPAGIMLEEASS